MSTIASVSEVVQQLHGLGALGYDDKDRTWFLPFPTGVDPAVWDGPVVLDTSAFRRYLARTFRGIVPSEKACKKYIEAASAAAWSGAIVRTVPWSSWNKATQTLTCAIGPAVVLYVTGTGTTAQHNGAGGVVYELPEDFQPIDYMDLAAAFRPHDHTMPRLRSAILDDMPPPDPAGVSTHRDQQLLIMAWWIGTFIADACQGRPMLMLTGGKGCGKTVTARLLGQAYFGDGFEVAASVGGGRAVKDLMAGIAHQPVYIADDQNNVKRDIVDALCQVATGSRISLSTLHETLKLSTFKARASLVITSNRPAWALRDDLLERMLPIMLTKPAPSTVTMNHRGERVHAQRVGIWADTLVALQHALSSTYEPTRYATRFDSWEWWIRRVMDNAGWAAEIDAALDRLPQQRVAMACWADPFAAALHQAALGMKDNPRALSASDLFDLVMLHMGAGVPEEPADRPSARFRSPLALGKFLGTVTVQGSAVIDVTRGPDVGGAGTWIITPK